MIPKKDRPCGARIRFLKKSFVSSIEIPPPKQLPFPKLVSSFQAVKPIGFLSSNQQELRLNQAKEFFNTPDSPKEQVFNKQV